MKSLIYAFCFFISVLNIHAQNVGVGTSTPSGRLQINHRSSLSNPTLVLYDSINSFGGPAIQFRNAGGTKSWHIRTMIDHTSDPVDYLDFINDGTILATLNNSGNFGIGTFAPDQKLVVVGNFKLFGELNRTSTGTSNMIPIAYGNITGTGVINSGSGNFTVTRYSTGVYGITITGETYHYQTSTSVVTPVGSSAAIIVNTGSGAGSLNVYTYNASGVAVDNQFCFVAYKQ